VSKGTDYSTYLRINDLLKLQIPLTEDAPDELLFIVVHQSYELWFKVIVDELRRAAKELHVCGGCVGGGRLRTADRTKKSTYTENYGAEEPGHGHTRVSLRNPSN